jgi:hypothetical protein
LRHTAEEINYEDMHAGNGACKVAALVQLRDRRRDAPSDETPLPASGRFVSSTAGTPSVIVNIPFVKYKGTIKKQYGSLGRDH